MILFRIDPRFVAVARQGPASCAHARVSGVPRYARRTSHIACRPRPRARTDRQHAIIQGSLRQRQHARPETVTEACLRRTRKASGLERDDVRDSSAPAARPGAAARVRHPRLGGPDRIPNGPSDRTWSRLRAAVQQARDGSHGSTVQPAGLPPPKSSTRVHDAAYVESPRAHGAGRVGLPRPGHLLRPRQRRGRAPPPQGRRRSRRPAHRHGGGSVVCSAPPPGHHARPGPTRWASACSTASPWPRPTPSPAGSTRVLVVDWDVHHGNGTQEMFWRSPEVLYASLHQYPFYPGTGAVNDTGDGDGRGFTVNVPLAAGGGDDVYRSAFERAVLPVAHEFAPELVLISAGFDASARDPPRRDAPERRRRSDGWGRRCAGSPTKRLRGASRSSSRGATTWSGSRRGSPGHHRHRRRASDGDRSEPRHARGRRGRPSAREAQAGSYRLSRPDASRGTICLDLAR